MAGWTKAQYDASYSIRVERYFGGHPSRAGRPEVRLHYHEWVIKPILVRRWLNIVPLLTPAIDSDDFVLIIGAGFGWGVRALRTQIGCEAIGTDTSTYIQTEKSSDDSAEISAAITAAGLDPTTGRGLELLGFVRSPGSRAKELVLDEDLLTAASRSNVIAALGSNPTFICWEDLVDDSMSDQDVLDLIAPIEPAAARKFFIYTPTAARSAQDLATLSGHRVIIADFQSVVH